MSTKTRTEKEMIESIDKVRLINWLLNPGYAPKETLLYSYDSKGAYFCVSEEDQNKILIKSRFVYKGKDICGEFFIDGKFTEEINNSTKKLFSRKILEAIKKRVSGLKGV